MTLTPSDYEGNAALAAERPLIKASFRHTILCSAVETSDNHIIKMGMTSAARGPVMKAVLLYPVSRSAIKTSYYHPFVRHIHPHP
jgi:hypothetical protein